MKLIKEIDRVMRDRFFFGSGYRRDAVDRHEALCFVFDVNDVSVELAELWQTYWRKANIKHALVIDYYLRIDGCNQESVALLRLLIVEDFKEWVKAI